jgi:hypothetical protein
MVHHATFMASRAYLVGDAERYESPGAGDAQAFKLAKDVFHKNLPDALIPNFDGVVTENNPGIVALSAYVGIWVEFNQTFSLGFVGGKERVAFRSESFLGREPTRAESVNQVCFAIMSVTQGRCDIEATLDDNGG